MAFFDLIETMDRAVQAHLGGEEVQYAPQVGSPVVITGIFDERFVLAEELDAVGVEANSKAVWVRLSDLPTDPDEDEPTITIRSVAYRVRQRRRDGQGGITLLLHEVG